MHGCKLGCQIPCPWEGRCRFLRRGHVRLTGVTRQFQGSIDHIARYASERDRFPDKSLSDLQTIKDQLAGDISFLQEESQGLHTNLDELLLSNQDVEFNISQHEQALAIVRPEDRPQEEQLLQELRRA